MTSPLTSLSVTLNATTMVVKAVNRTKSLWPWCTTPVTWSLKMPSPRVKQKQRWTTLATIKIIKLSWTSSLMVIQLSLARELLTRPSLWASFPTSLVEALCTLSQTIRLVLQLNLQTIEAFRTLRIWSNPLRYLSLESMLTTWKQWLKHADLQSSTGKSTAKTSCLTWSATATTATTRLMSLASPNLSCTPRLEACQRHRSDMKSN